MGMFDWLKGSHEAPRTDAEIDDSIFGRTIHVRSHDFIGICARSRNKPFTLAWIDGGPDQSRTGRYLLLDGKTVLADGRMARPNDGQVADNGIFILNDWGALETLSGTFNAFTPDGRRILSHAFAANLYDNGLSEDGCFAACQTANAPGPDGNRLTIFDLAAGKAVGAFQPESGWAKAYQFFPESRRIRLIYHDGGTFDYGFDGTFIDRFKWLAVGLQKGDQFIIETLIGEVEGRPSSDLAAQLLPATETALGRLRADEGRLRARILKSRGICFEAVAEIKQALGCYEEALTLDPKVGVKRKAQVLRKVMSS